MVARTVLQYQLLEKLGAGGMGEIYKAQDTRLNRFVAIKVLPASMSADPAFRRRFIQEAQAASALNHPNIITIYDIITDGETQYMVVEYVPGKTLLELIPKEGLRVPQAIHYAWQIASALSAAHSAGIIHRDLKPANVMVNNDGLVKLLDFGLAKMVPIAADDLGKTVSDVVAPLTVEGTIMGTVNYMSPEQAEGRRIDARSDIFSFGALLYEMLTGRYAFHGDSMISTLSAVLRDDIRPIGEFAPDVPVALEQIVVRCLKKDPDQRFQTMQEVQGLLTTLKQQSDSGALYSRPTVPTIVPPVPAPTKRRDWKAMALGVSAVLVMVLVMAGGYWWMAQNPRRMPTARPTQTTIVESTPPLPGGKPVPEKRSPLLANAPENSSAAVSPAAPAATVRAPLAATEPVTLGDGVPIRLVLAEDVPSSAKEGDPVRFRVAEALSVNNTVLIHKGAAAMGVIVDAEKRKILGLGGKMTFRLERVNAVDGQKVAIRATPSRHKDGSSKRTLDAGRKEKGLAAPAGTEYEGYIDGEATVQVRH